MKKIVLIITSLLVILITIFLLYLNLDTEEVSFSNPKNDIIYFAHRGYTFDFPENSYASIQEAHKRGFNGIEIDIFNTKDDKLVLFHDKELFRMLRIHGDITKTNFDEVKKYNMCWGRKMTDQKVIELETVFKDFPDFYYYLDIKNPSSKNIELLYSLIKKYRMESKVIIAHAEIIPHFLLKLKHPEIANALEGFNAGKEYLIKFIPKKLRPNFYSCFFHKTNKKQMDFYKTNNLLNQIIVYDITKDNYKKTINEYGLKNLIIDIKTDNIKINN